MPTLEQLKAAAYDKLALMQQAERELANLNRQIAEYAPPAAKLPDVALD